jgi:hypothetical protein
MMTTSMVKSYKGRLEREAVLGYTYLKIPETLKANLEKKYLERLGGNLRGQADGNHSAARVFLWPAVLACNLNAKCMA